MKSTSLLLATLLGLVVMAPVTLLSDLPSVSEIQERINRRYDETFKYDKGKYLPYVCSVCDEFILHRNELQYLPLDQLKKNQDCLKWSSVLEDESRIPDVEEYYKFSDTLPPTQQAVHGAYIYSLALSPRGTLGKKGKGNRSKLGLTCCCTCKSDVTKGNTPFLSIVNKNFVGCAPQCLVDLTDLELAMITPCKGYGYCMTYTGGAMKNLRGTLTFMRVEERQIAESTEQFKGLGLTDHVVVLLSGEMTKSQLRQARNHVRIEKVIAAVEWLVQHNVRWKHVNLEDIRKELAERQLFVLDKSKEVEGQNANVEKQELFSCYYPDSSLDEYHGGFHDPEAFKKFADLMQSEGHNIGMKLHWDRRLSKNLTASFW